MTVRTCISRLERIFESDELPPSEDTERNEFHASKTLNGRVAVKGDLDAVTGEMLLNALSTLTKPRNPMDDPPAPAPRRGSGPMRSQRFCTATSTRARRPRGWRATPSIPARERAGPRACRRGPRVDRLGRRSGPVRRQRHRPHATLGPLSIATARRLACDCHLTPIVMSDSVPIDLGRNSRTVSKKQRRALIARDHGCAFPGCGAVPAHCEGHHVTHWADGGPTDLDNLVLLCRYHHGLLHPPTGK